MTDNKDMKKELRVNLLAKRRDLDKKIIAVRSDDMAEILYAWPYYQKARVIMLFMSMPDEPQMMKVIKHAWQQGKTVCIPHMRQQFGLMDAAIIDNMDSLVEGRFNLLVPDPKNLKIVNPELIDLIVVPAVAYDYAGNRLGMGAGYYDRFIPEAFNAVLIGAIWSSHIVDNVPAASYDKPVHYLLDEHRITSCNAGKNMDSMLL